MNALAEPLTPADAVHTSATLDRPPLAGAVRLPLALLKPSPTNPRKAFATVKLQELADSIKAHTQLQAILARPAPGAKAGEALYEIVCGERRWRACTLAETGTIDAVVRDMTDFEALEVQLIENLEREDLTELEEAEGYSQLLRKPDGQQGYANAEELAKRIGKSRSYVFQRLKLLDLKDAGRQALAGGKIPFSIALLIARLPTEEDQAAATKTILLGWGGEPYTYKAAENYIHSHFHLALDRAPFKITDATLVPAAGSCRDCSKRTGANPDLFTDVKKADTCTDGACYRAKETAHRDRIKVEAEAKGIEVVSGKAAKKIKPQAYSDLKGWLALDKVHAQLGDKPLRKLLGKKLPEVKLLEDPDTHDLVEMVREDEALAMLREAGVIKASRMPTTAASERDAERAAKAEVAYRQALAMAITEAAKGNAGADSTFRAQLLVDVGVLLWKLLSNDHEKRVERLLAWEHIASDYQDKANGKRKADRIRAMDAGEFTRYLVAVLCSGDIHVNAYTAKGSKPTVLLDLAARLGVDAKAIREDQRQLTRVKADKPAAAPARGAKKADLPHRSPPPASGEATPETALAAALKKATNKPAKAPPKGVEYLHPVTGETWSGKGLKPAWLRAELDQGGKLDDFRVKATVPAAASSITAEAANPFREQ